LVNERLLMSTDFSKPVVGDAYATLLPGIVTALQDLARGLEPTLTGTSTNIPTGAVRWNASTTLWERYSGVSWAVLATSYSININGSAGSATTATHLAGGAAGAVHWQSASGASGFSGVGIAGQVLTSGGAGVPTWTSQSALVAGSASAVAWTAVTGKPTLLSTIATNDLGNYGGWITGSGNTTGTASNITAYTINQSVGTANSPSFVDVTITSDESVKTNWRGFRPDMLAKFAQVKRGIYDRLDAPVTQAGVSANSFQEVMSEGVTVDANGLRSISQSATLAILAELTALVLMQGARIAELEVRA
jgi:hypothetical protein